MLSLLPGVGGIEKVRFMKLNQVIAIEKGAKAENTSVLSEVYKLVQKGELFNGFAKHYTRRDEEGEELPPESKKVHSTVPGVLTRVRQSNADYWAIAARKEYSNTTAKADIVVDGTTIASEVPVTYLLFLEKQLTDLRTFLGKLPVLDPNDDWHEDTNSGLHKTEAVKTHRTKKVQRAIVKYDATENHPAQTEMITDDVLAGYWNTTKMSGALPLPERVRLSDKVNALLRAVKEAREAANSLAEVETNGVEKQLLNFVFGS